jgi:hypothetical protein
LAPAGVVFQSWDCTALTGGANSSCGAGGATGTGSIVNRTINVAANGSVRYRITAHRVITNPVTVHGLINTTASAVVPPNGNQSGTITAVAGVTFS